MVLDMVHDAMFTKLHTVASGMDEHEMRTVFLCPTSGSWPLKVEGKMSTPMSDTFDLNQMRSTNVPYGFQMSMTCQSSDYCSGVMVMGTFEAEQTDQDGSFEVRHQVLAVWPALPLVDVPEGVPCEIAEEAEDAGACLWIDPGGSAVRLRRMAELLFPKEAGSRTPLATRIEKSATEAEATTLAHAIRVLGNDAAHDRRLQISTVIEGAEILSHLLHRIYPPPPSNSRQRVVDAARQLRRAQGDAD